MRNDQPTVAWMTHSDRVLKVSESNIIIVDSINLIIRLFTGLIVENILGKELNQKIPQVGTTYDELGSKNRAQFFLQKYGVKNPS